MRNLEIKKLGQKARQKILPHMIIEQLFNGF